ncbi:MAG: SBBP repeat-containing protein, partial [Candidatus Sulfotelmatobacter sp.]
VYSTYLGGSSTDAVLAVALDSSDNAYVTGHTSSSSFPTTTGAFQTTLGGLSDAFVTVINTAGSGYVYSTFLGGSSNDVGDGIAVDSSGNAYVTGVTESTNFPLQSPLQATYGGGPTDAFVTKLNPTGSALVYSTFLGGSQSDLGASIAVDGGNNAYVTGQTSSSNFPTVGATQSTPGGGNDAFVSEIDSTGSALAFSTYLGGSLDEDDGGDYGAIAVDSAGANIYATGNTASTNFPIQAAYQKTNASTAGDTDAFVVKYAQTTFDLAATTPSAVAPGTSGISTVTLTAVNGYNSPVNLTCSVSGTGSPLPACSTASFSPASPVTPTAGGATTTLTITTTGASGAMFLPRTFFYAMWLPVAGMSLVGMGFSSARSRRKKLLGFLMIGMVMAVLLLMPACGGSSGSGGGGGGGGGGGTPAGSYTVTITGTGTDASATMQSTQVTLTVN